MWQVGTVGRTVALAMALENRAQGERIAELRERKGLSQEALARLVGVSKGAVQQWEAGGGIRGANLRNVAAVLDTTPEGIRGDAEPVNPFSVVAEIDARVQEFRRYSDEMRAGFERVEAKLDALTAAMVDGNVIQSDVWTRMQEAAVRLAPPADGATPEPRTASS